MNRARNMSRESKNIIFNVIFVLLNAVTVIYLYKEVITTTVLIAALSVIFFIKYRSHIHVGVFAFGVIAAFLEMWAISQGAWSYAAPNFFNVPLWLFFLWGNTAWVIYQTAIECERLGLHK